MTNVSVLRVRPASQQRQGLLIEELTDAIQIAGVGDVIESREFRVPGTEVEAPTLDKLQSMTSDLLAASDILAIDMGFSYEDGREYLYGWLIASAMRQIPAQLWQDGKHVIILAQEIPQANSELFDLVIDATWRRRVSFAAVSGEVGTLDHHSLATSVANLAENARRDLSERSSELEASELAQLIFLRRRGVFRMHRGDDAGYFKFHYETGVKGSEALAARLEAYLIERAVNVVVFNSHTAAHWFADALHGACSSVRRSGREIAWVDESFIDVDLNLVDSAGDTWKDETERALGMLRGDSTRVCFATPAIDRARSLRSMQKKFRAAGENTLNLTILMNSEIGVTDLITLNCGAHSATATIRPQVSGRRGTEVFPLDFLFRVEVKSIPRSNWKAIAAEILPEVEYPRENSLPHRRHGEAVPRRSSADSVPFWVPNVAMWSLYEDYGVTEEPAHVVPRARAKDPVAHFPRLDSVNPWDAHWLAEAVTRRFEDTLGLDRADFAVLMPDEPTGAAPIADAMDLRCGVAVVRVPRSVIDGDDALPVEIYDEIGDWAGDELVVFDESSVTGSTLAHLARLVEAVTGDAPAAVGVVVDLTPPGRGPSRLLADVLNVPSERPPAQFALQRWPAGGLG